MLTSSHGNSFKKKVTYLRQPGGWRLSELQGTSHGVPWWEEDDREFMDL